MDNNLSLQRCVRGGVLKLARSVPELLNAEIAILIIQTQL